MDHSDGLMQGMFYGGLIMAAVPVSLVLGVGIYVLKRYLHRGNVSSTDSD
jgi:hypothetical protein